MTLIALLIAGSAALQCRSWDVEAREEHHWSGALPAMTPMARSTS
jgi:hypothetical protein